MNFNCAVVLAAIVSAALSGCVTNAPLSERALGQAFPLARDATAEPLAKISFSGDKKYESANGTPLWGDPLVCGDEGILRINEPGAQRNEVAVTASKEVAVTSVIQWLNTGWVKTCWPFVAFIPEPNASYVVVNERIGGKGMSALWTGVARQSCQVSVYRETPDGPQRVETRSPSFNTCRAAQR
ncbi:MAG: hypothetical protein ACM3Y9_10860 [Ignavibacteria bacterium]